MFYGWDMGYFYEGQRSRWLMCILVRIELVSDCLKRIMARAYLSEGCLKVYQQKNVILADSVERV